MSNSRALKGRKGKDKSECISKWWDCQIQFVIGAK